MNRDALMKQFTKRFSECVADAGSIYSLAKKCDVSIPTLKRYTSGSEPSLTMLVKIAEASSVNLLWLATGEGEKTKAIIQVGPAGEVAFTPFLENLRKFIIEACSLPGQMEETAKGAGIPTEELSSFLERRRMPSHAEVWKLIEVTGVSLAWLTSGSGSKMHLGTRLKGDFGALDRTMKLAAAINAQLAPLYGAHYLVHEVRSSSLAPEVQSGDVAIVDGHSRPSDGPGIFLLKDQSTEFLAKVIRVGGMHKISFTDKDIVPIECPVESQSSIRICGRLAYIYRLLRYG